MNKINHARFMRSVETNGKVMAEVEFSMELSSQQLEGSQESSQEGRQQKYVAVLENDGGLSYKLRKIYKNDSDMAIDWYDNTEHLAYMDVTNSMFGDSQLSEDRESFVLDVLDCEGVRADMESGNNQ